MATSDHEALRACRQCYGSGDCFQCSGVGRVPVDVGGHTQCPACKGGRRCILCGGRGEVAYPTDQVFPAQKPLTFAR